MKFFDADTNQLLGMLYSGADVATVAGLLGHSK